jgi:hypothetical protein
MIRPLMENSVVNKSPSRLDLHIFGLIKSSAEGWLAITALVVIVVILAGVFLWR